MRDADEELAAVHHDENSKFIIKSRDIDIFLVRSVFLKVEVSYVKYQFVRVRRA